MMMSFLRKSVLAFVACISISSVSHAGWKVVLMTGDDSIEVFDNAREKLAELMVDMGVMPEDIRQLSMNPLEQSQSVPASTKDNLLLALQDLALTNADRCLVHLTSHGNKKGFYMRDIGFLTPTELDSMLDATCGNLPTVVLISACYSGVFINAKTEATNRVILTAARHDRPSFGCSADETYTYWDNCLIDNIQTSTSWEGLYTNLQSCITAREAEQGFEASYPQGFFGSQIQYIK